LDIGFFPGTILRQLKIIFHSQIHCYGVGLNIDNEFRNYMLDYLENCFDLELDPFYSALISSISLPLPSKWPLMKRLIVQFSDLFCPIYREGHFAVFQKR